VRIGDRSQGAIFNGLRDASRRLMTTIHGILDLSRIETGAFDVMATPLQIPNLIERAAKAGLIERQPDGAGVQHSVIIAPRGMGKTTVMLMIQFAIKDRGLNDRWQVVRGPHMGQSSCLPCD